MRGSSLQKREGALTAAGRFAFSGFGRGVTQPHCLERRVIRSSDPPSGPARWRRSAFTLIAMAVGWPGLFPGPADAAGPTAVTVTATGTITRDSGTYGNLVGKAYTVYISFQAAVLNNTCRPGSGEYCAITSSGTTIALDIAGEPAVSFSGNISGNYTISPYPSPIAQALLVGAGLDDTFNGHITYGYFSTNTRLFTDSDTFFQNVSHTLNPATDGGIFTTVGLGFPGAIVGSIATIRISTQETRATSDFNGDGFSDVLFQNTDGSVATWLMNGTTPIAQPLIGDPGPSWHAIATGDFNGDGYSDILWQNDNGQVAIWLMNGTTPTTEQVIGNPGPAWRVIGTGDFNGDGQSDIVFRNTNGAVAIWLMNGTTPAAELLVQAVDPSWQVIGTGDFNGDGKSDILFQNANGSVAIWLMDGAVPTAEPVVGNPGPSWHVIGTGDFNGDGKSDILFQNANGSVAIWLMNGTVPIAEPVIGNPGPSWHVIGTGDFNGDGKSDILFQNTNGSVAIWLMNGTTPTAEPFVQTVDPSWQAVVGK
jgi:hypothetical protein